jgi:hypothetical protein
MFKAHIIKQVEPILIEYFGYKRRMLEEELRYTFYKYYRNDANLPNRDKYMVDVPLGNEPAVDTTLFSYQRYIPRDKVTTMQMFYEPDYIMDTEHDVELPTDDNFDKKLKKLVFEKYKQNDTIYNVLAIVSVMYHKYQNNELYTDAIQWSENLPCYLTEVRPDMLKMFQFLHSGLSQKSGLPKPITLDNGKEKVTLDNSCYWLSGLFLEYLQIYLGVATLKEAEEELKEKYAAKKGRKADNPTLNLIMVGTSRLLKQHSTLETKSKQLRLIGDYLELLGFFDTINSKEDKNKNDENQINATISYLEKQGFTPKWKPKYLEDYNTSPNNPSCNNLW